MQRESESESGEKFPGVALIFLVAGLRFLLGGLAAVLFVFWSLVVFYGIPGRKASWA